MSNTPTVKAKVTVKYDFVKGIYEQDEIEVEVLTVHFEKRTMRVRYMSVDWFGKGPKIQTTDISAEPFFEKYWKK